MTKKLQTPCSYQGGKQRIASQIVDILFQQNKVDDDTVFYDLCCGSGAVSIELINRGIKPQNIRMLDKGVFGLVYKLIGNGEFDLHKFNSYVDSIPKEVEKIQDYMKELSKQSADIDTPYVYLLLQASSFGSKQIWIENNGWKNTSFRNYWLPTETSSRRSPVNPMMPMPETLRERVVLLVEKLKGVKGAYCDIENIKEFEDNSIVYIDPPYQNTTKYGYQFELDSFVNKFKNRIYVSEGVQMTDSAIQVSGSRSKGGISGNRKSKNEEWLNIYNDKEELNEYEVNFILSGNYLIDAKDEEHAKDMVNDFINSRWEELEILLHTGIKDDDYTTDVIKS